MMPKRPPHRKHTYSLDGVKKALCSIQARCWYALVAGTLLLLAMFLIAITPERYDLKAGDIARKTITASKDVVDEISTARQREEAARQVEPSYLFKEGVTDEVMQNLNQVMTQITYVQQYGQQLLAQAGEGKAKDYQFSATEMEYAKSLLTAITLTDYQIKTILRTSETQMNDLIDNLTSAVENTMNTTVREGYVNESIQYLQQIIAYKTDIDLLQNVVTPVLRRCVKPNMVIDQEATAKLQDDARQAVEPVIYKQGQNIVLQNERVTVNQLEMLRSLGLLDNEGVDVAMYLGAGGLMLVMMLVLILILRIFDPAVLESPKKLTILMLILCLTLGFCIFGQLINVYMAPVLLGVMMLTGLLGTTSGVAGCIALSILSTCLVAGGDSSYSAEMVNLLLTSIIGGFLAVALLRNKPYRQQVLLCGVVTALSNFVVVLLIGLMTNNSVQMVFTNSVWSAGSALIAALLCIGFDPILETVFHLATPSKLMELCNPNQPLLRRLLLEAPGTYHHSIIVANLAEAAAEAVHANPLLARAGAYFHDIGKLKRPLYFKENQMGENPHNHTNPYVSAAIVTAHTRDGLMMAQQYRLPVEIQSIISEHHGDTPVMFFYHKALQQADGQPVDMNDFRYDGKRPQSREGAIVMLADTVEAAVRSMPDPTPKAIEEFIEHLVRSKLEDGQLSDAPITLRDIDKICNAFATVLNGVFHERIEYPNAQAADMPMAPQKLPPVGPQATIEAAKPEAATETEAPAEENRAATIPGDDAEEAPFISTKHEEPYES